MAVQEDEFLASKLHGLYEEVGPEGLSSAMKAIPASSLRGHLDKCLESLEENRSIVAVLAAALPLLQDALPRDARGACVVPHPHPLKKQVVLRRGYSATGCEIFFTGKACDNCDTSIEDKEYWCCDGPCEVDFCKGCYMEMQALFSDRDMEHAKWVVRFVTSAARYMLVQATPATREAFVKTLAFDWPSDMFSELVRVIVDVADASVVHIEDNSHIEDGTDFWHSVGFLQILYAANQLPVTEKRLGFFSEGPRLSEDRFVLRGVDKCEAYADWVRWSTVVGSTEAGKMHESVIQASPFEISPQFTCFLSHTNLVPLTFRRRCIWFDATSKDFTVRRTVKVSREPVHLRAGFVTALGYGFFPGMEVRLRGLQGAPELNGLEGELSTFDAATCRWKVKLKDTSVKSVKPRNLEHADAETSWSFLLAELISVKFEGEDGQGPGVDREFLTLALQNALEADKTSGCLWEYSPELRNYWFSESSSDEDMLAAFRACGALLGHAIFMDVFLPPVFPQPLYMLLLRDLGSPHARDLTVADLAKVSPQLARGLEQLVEYDGENVAEVFPLDWPRQEELEILPRDARGEYVRGYVDWFFTERYAGPVKAFCQGFRAVVGHSQLLRRLVSSEQLETVICGVEEPMDMAAVRRGAKLQGWTEADEEYLNDFWNVVDSLNEDERNRFAIFVSSSARMPSKGWADFALQVQKNGKDDDRLPTAYTCFKLLLLPHYSSKDVLRTKLMQALAETQGFGLQ